MLTVTVLCGELDLGLLESISDTSFDLAFFLNKLLISTAFFAALLIHNLTHVAVTSTQKSLQTTHYRF